MNEAFVWSKWNKSYTVFLFHTSAPPDLELLNLQVNILVQL